MPKTWLIEEAITKQTGRDLIAIKKPVFRASGSFDFTRLGRPGGYSPATKPPCRHPNCTRSSASQPHLPPRRFVRLQAGATAMALDRPSFSLFCHVQGATGRILAVRSGR